MKPTPFMKKLSKRINIKKWKGVQFLGESSHSTYYVNNKTSGSNIKSHFR